MKYIYSVIVIAFFCGCSCDYSDPINNKQNKLYSGSYGLLYLEICEVSENNGQTIVDCRFVNVSEKALWICSKANIDSLYINFKLPFLLSTTPRFYYDGSYELWDSWDMLVLCRSHPLESRKAGYNIPIFSEYVRLCPQKSVNLKYVIPGTFNKLENISIINLEDIKKLSICVGIYELDLENIDAEGYIYRQNNNTVFLSNFWNKRDKEINEGFIIKNPLSNK